MLVGGKERGNTAFAAGSYDVAHSEYSAALEADPALRTPFVAQLFSNRAAAAARLGRFAEAEADAEEAIEIDPSYAKAYVR